MIEEINKHLSVKYVLLAALRFFNKNPKILLGFVILNYLLCILSVYSWKTFLIWPLLVIIYVLWGGVFRYYFERKPYFHFKSLFYSMIPSTKIVVLSVLVVSVFLLLPIAILFIPNLPKEFVLPYSRFLQVAMHESDIMDLIVNLVVVLFSPLIMYRPMLAWIAALLGRSGSLRFAWEKTKGNYWEFLLLAVLIDLSIGGIYKCVLYMGGNIYISLIPISILVVYFNIVVAKIYEFFFLELDNK